MSSSGPDNVREHLHEGAVDWPPKLGWHSRARPIIDATRQFVADNGGLLLVLSSQLFFSIMNVFVKELHDINDPISTFEVMIVRMGITYICSLAYLIAARIDDPILGPKELRPLLILRGVSGFFGLFGIYYSLQYLSLSDATVLTFLSPLCTAIAGAVFLKEQFRRTQVLAGIVSLVGVVLIARPPFLFGDLETVISTGITAARIASTPEERMFAVGVALFGVLGATGAYVSIRAIGKRAHAMHTMSYFSLLTVIVASIAMVVTRTPFIIPSRLNWFALLIMIGILGFIAQILLTMGLQRESAGRATMGVYTQIVFATIFQRIFFHTTPPLLSIIGTILILSSALYVALTKQKSKQGSVELRPDDPDHMESALHTAHVKTLS
ncbi:hypothetical protein AX14_000319 [Amanita brunnescens Koide BX004]|nr:hypothetical protein AX14_000319 [Amanita brunnescens Koide BX004]